MSLSHFQTKRLTVDSHNVSTELPQTYKLSAEQLKFYEDKGCIVIKELIDFGTLYSCKQRFVQLAKGQVPKGAITVMKERNLMDSGLTGEDVINKIQDILFDEVLATYTENPRLLDVVSQLIGDNLMAMHSMLINKPPGTGIHPPHQDMHYFPFRPADKILAAWTAIDHVTEENGCLYIVPGSHKGPLYTHGYPADKDGKVNKMYHGIVDPNAAPLQERVPLVMSPGDTAFFHPLLVHGSGPNTTKGYRKSISCHYAASECEFIDVTGTSHEELAREMEEILRKRGHEASFVDIWRYRSKLVKGVKCNL